MAKLLIRVPNNRTSNRDDSGPLLRVTAKANDVTFDLYVHFGLNTSELSRRLLNHLKLNASEAQSF